MGKGHPLKVIIREAKSDGVVYFSAIAALGNTFCALGEVFTLSEAQLVILGRIGGVSNALSAIAFLWLAIKCHQDRIELKKDFVRHITKSGGMKSKSSN